MATEILVTATQLKTQAESLMDLNERFQALVADLQAEEVDLAGMWDGEAKDAFRTAFSRDKDNMYRFYNAVSKYVQVLEQVAVKYAQAEQANTEVAQNRSY